MWFFTFPSKSLFRTTFTDSYSMHDPSKEPFLPLDSVRSKDMIMQRRQSRSPFLYLIPLSFAVGIFTTLMCITVLGKRDTCDVLGPFESKGTYSPAEHLIERQDVVFTSGFGDHQTIYQGPSTEATDKAWQDLYGFGLSRIPKVSAARLVNKTVPLPGDPGFYVVSLNVFHQLHCVNMIRLRLWSSETFEPTHELMGIEHLSHCLDALRQSLMCSVDITPLPWQWDPVAMEAKEVAKVQHTCRNFEKVRKWAQDNEVKKFDRKIYVPDDLRSM